MKKSLLFVLAIVLCLSLCVVLAACDNNVVHTYLVKGIASDSEYPNGVESVVASADITGRGYGTDGATKNFVIESGKTAYIVIRLARGYQIGTLSVEVGGNNETFTQSDSDAQTYYATIGKMTSDKTVKFKGQTEQLSSSIIFDASVLEEKPIENARYTISAEGISAIDGNTVYTHAEFVEFLKGSGTKDLFSNYKQARTIVIKAWLVKGTETENKLFPYDFLTLENGRPEKDEFGNDNTFSNSTQDVTMEAETMKTVFAIKIYENCTKIIFGKGGSYYPDEYKTNTKLTSEINLMGGVISEDIITYVIDGVEIAAKDNAISLDAMIKANKVSAKIKLTPFLRKIYDLGYLKNLKATLTATDLIQTTLNGDYLTFDLKKPYEYSDSVAFANTYTLFADSSLAEIVGGIKTADGIAKVEISNAENKYSTSVCDDCIYYNVYDETVGQTVNYIYYLGASSFSMHLTNVTEYGESIAYEIGFGDKTLKFNVKFSSSYDTVYEEFVYEKNIEIVSAVEGATVEFANSVSESKEIILTVSGELAGSISKIVLK